MVHTCSLSIEHVCSSLILPSLPPLLRPPLQAMGDKTAARRAAVECGVSVVPGTNQPITDAAEAIAFAQEYEYPVILKAAMGGGGRGMRIVRTGEQPGGGIRVQRVSGWLSKAGPAQPLAGRANGFSSS